MLLITIWHIISIRSECIARQCISAKLYKLHEINANARDTQRLESRIFSRSILNKLYYQLNNKTASMCESTIITDIDGHDTSERTNWQNISRLSIVLYNDARPTKPRLCHFYRDSPTFFVLSFLSYW